MATPVDSLVGAESLNPSLFPHVLKYSDVSFFPQPFEDTEDVLSLEAARKPAQDAQGRLCGRRSLTWATAGDLYSSLKLHLHWKER